MALTRMLLCFTAPFNWSVASGENNPNPNRHGLNRHLDFLANRNNSAYVANYHGPLLRENARRFAFRTPWNCGEEIARLRRVVSAQSPDGRVEHK
jgi:hypothetical protein